MARPPLPGLHTHVSRLEQTLKDFVGAEAVLIEATVEALRQIDKMRPEDRTTEQIASFLVAFGSARADGQPNGEATRARYLLGQLIQHMEDVDWHEDFQSFVDPSDS